MNTGKPKAGRSPTFYTIGQAAWILGVTPATVSRAIRIGTLRAVRRRSGLMVLATELARHLGEPASDDGSQEGPRP